MTPPKAGKATPTRAQRDALLQALEARFEAHPHRHEDIDWGGVRERLEASPPALASLHAMEESGGEPDVAAHDGATGEYVFYDFAEQSPKGRRSCCYDRDARVGRKKHPPESSAVEMADAMGAALLTREEYARLQALEPVDTKTSSWLRTPADIRSLGGAIFGDRRYETVFTYHNGADSYYAARGFRCSLRV